MNRLLTRGGIWVMHLFALLPLPLIRQIGCVLGVLLYLLVTPRRRVVHINLALCFPTQTRRQRCAWAIQSFIYFAQAWLDRSWLWHASEACVRQRLQLTGALHELQGDSPTVIFAPHFVGMDAGWTALTAQLDRTFITIYTDQANKLIDRWILRGRRRFNRGHLFSRAQGVQSVVSALRAGQVLYLLPDMNFGPEESIFVPFYGVPAATVPSLSRFARLGRAKVVAVITRMTRTGYEIQVQPAWNNFPSNDVRADTACMNKCLQDLINAAPTQYYWVHKRFKTRPPGQANIY